jgi:phage shock protein A
MIAELLLLGTGGAFLFHDYKNGFVKSTRLINWALNRLGHMVGQRRNFLVEGKQYVEDYAAQVSQLRTKIAETKASAIQFQKRAHEERNLVAQYEETALEALRQGIESVAMTAASGKINCEKRAALFEEASTGCSRSAQALEEHLELAEAEFDIAKTKLETMQVDVVVGEAQQQAYELASEVTEGGFTPKGAIEDIRLKAEHRRITSQLLLTMVRPRGETKMVRFMQDQEIANEISTMRKKISLPAPDAEAPQPVSTECGAHS